MKMNLKTVEIYSVLLIISFSLVGFYYLTFTSSVFYPYGHTIVYQVYRSFSFNGIFVNYSEFLIYTFTAPKNGTFEIIVQEPEQTYYSIVNASNYKIISVKYFSTNASLNANQGEIENIYLPFIWKIPAGKTIKILSYNFVVIGPKTIKYNKFDEAKAIELLNFTYYSINGQNYNLTIIYYYNNYGLLLKAVYLWQSSGPYGYYFRNITDTLFSISS